MCIVCVRSSNLGLVRLSCWFNTLQEAVSTVEELLGVSVGEDRAKAPSTTPTDKLQSTRGTLGDLAVLDAFPGVEDDKWKTRAAVSVTLDAAVVELIASMVDAIEVSVWDAALDK